MMLTMSGLLGDGLTWHRWNEMRRFCGNQRIDYHFTHFSVIIACLFGFAPSDGGMLELLVVGAASAFEGACEPYVVGHKSPSF